MTEFKSKIRSFGLYILDWAKRNYLMLGYILAVLLIELTGVAVTSGKFYMTEPWIYFTFIALPCILSLFIKKHNYRYALFTAALGANFILDMMFIVIYDSTGTIFDYAMLNLRGDAMSIVESVPISFTYIFVTAIIIAMFCTAGRLLKRYMPDPTTSAKKSAAAAVLMAAVIGSNALLIYFTNYNVNKDDLSYKLYNAETGTYSNKGIIGNFANELARGIWFSDIEPGDRDELSRFIYKEQSQPTEYFGVASGYNVVTVLCESFEWFTFLSDIERYPNGFAKLLKKPDQKDDEETEDTGFTQEELDSALRQLYPNLYRFYESRATVVLDNSHSLEKTDISENKSILGNYPLNEYINYSYPNNTLPFSLPNVLKGLYGIESNSFHDGLFTFYNRNIHHTNALGFESYTSSESMDYPEDTSGIGERNLDSIMMESCKEKMFPTDRPFNTYITTITQHGQYAYRDNLKPYYDKMDELGILPFVSGDDDGNALRYYCAAGMDFDAAIGIMLDYLEQNGLADKTIITLFGDHNTYYQGLSNYVKNIYSYDVDNYTNLYRVPVMIKVGNLDLGNPVIEKFTCLVDIYPTILDLLGIRTFSNLTYGVSAFSSDSSVMYSRAYDRFLTDKVFFNSIDHIIYKTADADPDYIKTVEQKSLVLLDKISHANRMYAGDFFKGDEEGKFYDMLRQINGV